MATFILTWNPTKWLWDSDDHAAKVAATAEGRPVDDRWSVGNRVGGIVAGDRAFLLRQHDERGIVASGRFTGDVFQAPHWDGTQREANFGPLAWDTVLEAPDRLPVEVLGAVVPSVPWARIQAGGIEIPAEAAAQLESLWLEHLGGGAIPGHRGAVRSAENVWAEVQDSCRRWMAEGTPVYTLQKNVANYITEVTDDRIGRRSDEGRREGAHTFVTRAELLRVWRVLQAEGRAVAGANALYFTYALLLHAIPGIGFEAPPVTLVFRNPDEALRTFDPGGAGPVPALVRRTGGGGGGDRGGGGEGEVHKALKERVKLDPVGTVGERLTYEDEDLTEVLGSEVRFITGDRVDLLMKDEQGRYVVIEVEPWIGPDGHIGFHQAGKYRVLIAMDKGIPVEQVRAMVVATSIDENLRTLYTTRYGIECHEVLVA